MSVLFYLREWLTGLGKEVAQREEDYEYKCREGYYRHPAYRGSQFQDRDAGSRIRGYYKDGWGESYYDFRASRWDVVAAANADPVGFAQLRDELYPDPEGGPYRPHRRPLDWDDVVRALPAAKYI